MYAKAVVFELAKRFEFLGLNGFVVCTDWSETIFFRGTGGFYYWCCRYSRSWRCSHRGDTGAGGASSGKASFGVEFKQVFFFIAKEQQV